MTIVTFSAEPVTRYVPLEVTVTVSPEEPRVESESVPCEPSSVMKALASLSVLFS